MNATAAVMPRSTEIALPAPTSPFAALIAAFRRAVEQRRADTLEAVVGRALEGAFRQFGRELAG